MSEEQDTQEPQPDAAEPTTESTATPKPEQEYHPADPHFNPAHPDNAAWRSGPPSPDMPAEAGIVAMFQDPKGPISASDVHVEGPPSGPEFQRDPEPETATAETTSGAESGTGAADEKASDTTTTTTKKPARRAR